MVPIHDSSDRYRPVSHCRRSERSPLHEQIDVLSLAAPQSLACIPPSHVTDPRVQVVTDLANAADRSESKLPDRQSEIRVLRDTLTAKTDQEEKEEKKMLDRDVDDIGEGSARGTVRATVRVSRLWIKERPQTFQAWIHDRNARVRSTMKVGKRWDALFFLPAALSAHFFLPAARVFEMVGGPAPSTLRHCRIRRR